MMGLEHTEVMADKWQKAKIFNMVLVSSSVFSKGSKMSKTMLNILSGAQDRKKMIVTVINILFVFFLLSICLVLLWEESR